MPAPIDWSNEFQGKRVVITGASGKLGGWLATRFAAAGARLMLSDRNSAGLDAVRRGLPDSASEVLLHETELGDDQSLAGLVARVRESWGAPDILINAAGIFPAGDLLETTNEHWDRIFAVDLRAAFVLMRECAKAMIENGHGGSFVNVTSGATRVLRPGLIPYGVAKTGLERLTRGFALELGRYGIRVNAVEPGFMPAAGVGEEAIIAASRATPLGRVSGPDDAPNAIMFLCSSLSSFTTGATLNTDGGYPLTAAAADASANANNPEKLLRLA